MRKTYAPVLVVSVVIAMTVGTSRAEGAMFTAICDDLACAGGNDFIVQDNSALDTIALVGATSFSTSAFGFSLAVNTSQSKPVIGSAIQPQLDLSFVATTLNNVNNNVFLYLSDTDFLGAVNPYSFLLTMGGTNSGGSGTETGRLWGGTSNTALQFSGANLRGTVGPLAGNAYSGSVTGSFVPVVSPYSLTLGVAVNRTTPGTTTGDLNVQAVPEPATLTLFGSGLALAALRRRRMRG